IQKPRVIAGTLLSELLSESVGDMAIIYVGVQPLSVGCCRSCVVDLCAMSGEFIAAIAFVARTRGSSALPLSSCQ
ncbi:MAG: hypothetical protein RR326_08415, partial [Stenotrophomonas sp.]